MTHSPRAYLWENALPWAWPSLIQTSGVPLESADHVPEVVSAAAADGSSLHAAGTSGIAKMRNAASRSAAGRPPVVRPNAAKTNKSKPNTPPPNECAVSEPSPRRNLLPTPILSPSVVTQQKIFSAALRPPRLPRTPASFGSQSGQVLQPRVPPSRSQCFRPRCSQGAQA